MEERSEEVQTKAHQAHQSLGAYLRKSLLPVKFYIGALAVLAVAASFFEVSVNYKIKQIIDTIGASPPGGSTAVTGLLLAFVAYKLLHHGMFFIGRLFDIHYLPALLFKITEEMYLKTLRHGLHWFDSHLSGEIAGKITDFRKSVGTLIPACFRALNTLTTVLIGIFFLLKVNFLLAMVAAVFVSVYTPVLFVLLRKQMGLHRDLAAARQEGIGIINDSIANIFGVKIIGSLTTEIRLKVRPALRHWKECDRRTRQFDAYFVDNADTIMITVMSAVQIFLLAYLYQLGQITAGGFAFVAMVTLSIHTKLDSFLESLLFTINPEIAVMKASFSFVADEVSTDDKKEAILLPRVQGDVTFDRVTFAYPGSQTPLYKDFYLKIPAGERLGIVGSSGAGKTTLIKCLLRYFDVQAGQIRIDSYNIADVTQESLRAQFSVIPQDVTLFHRSILENLKLARHDARFEEIVDACKRARIHEEILAMDKGYDSIVGERGVKVSGGQRQRIAIARALLKNAPILILDEATSALDTPTERLIQASLDTILETSQATVIAIAHRLSTLKHMDRIVVLEGGKIVEEGKHDTLISGGGVYQKLWEMQAILPKTLPL